MTSLHTALPVLGIYLAAVVSPGPNFYLLTQTTLAYSRKAGLQTALGFTCGAAIYVAAGFLGLTAFISRTTWLYIGLRLAGGGYILFIGLRILRRLSINHRTAANQADHPSPAGEKAAFTNGLVTMLTNPKAGLLMLSLFATAIDPQSPSAARWIIAAGMPLLTLTWHSGVALFFSNSGFRRAYTKFGQIINPLLGLILVIFGIQILLSTGNPP